MWELARINQRKSTFIISLMGLFLIILGYFVGYGWFGEEGSAIGIFFALFVFFILLLTTFAAGKKIILNISNARKASKEEYQQLYNVVEEMSIAAGLNKMPEIYVIDDPAPNAFAVGLNPDNSAVGVTTGLLRIMNRDELQGVIAHEISHIINRDSRLLTIATIMVASISLISNFFLRSFIYSRGEKSKRGGGGGKGQAIVFLIALIFIILAPIFTRLLYFSLSRKREYLADACGARLTRYPEGLASALEKIANSSQVLRSASKVTAPMYIANPFGPRENFFTNLTSTHPPIEKRIKILRSIGNEFSLEKYNNAYNNLLKTNKKLFSTNS